MLAGQVKQYEAQLSRLEGITAEYEDLNRQVKESADNYQLYKKKEEEARITDELDQNKITNVSVAEAPVQSQIPVKPNRPLNLILGLFLGALLSIGSVVIAEFLRDTVLTPRELELLTGQRVLASLPNTGRAPRVIVVESPEPFQAQDAEPKTVQPVQAVQPKLSQPKLVHDPVLKWASGE
jgi:hypothetical protein